MLSFKAVDTGQRIGQRRNRFPRGRDVGAGSFMSVRKHAPWPSRASMVTHTALK